MNNYLKVASRTMIVAGLLLFGSPRGFGFSLLGPYADWMTSANGYHRGDIGGPMDLGEEYRWNVPVLTYGFDQSFLDYFGTNGVAAAESAISILNNLPVAAAINPANYPTQATTVNSFAQGQGLLDLKSATLSLLVEHMGLAQPMHNIFAVRRSDATFITYSNEVSWPPGTIPFYIVERNFDPQAVVVSHSVNGTLYTGQVVWNGMFVDVTESPSIPAAPIFPAVADGLPASGTIFTGLTRDDAGGLRYLLSAANTNVESLLANVRGSGTNTGNFVGVALRPGVEKVTFTPHAKNSQTGAFLPMTNQYTDTYISNTTTQHQQLERVVTLPDFLFLAGDTGQSNLVIASVLRTDTSNWLSQAAVNGNSARLGPGLIRPAIGITFHKLGLTVQTIDGFSADYHPHSWATFDGSNNPAIVYPQGPLLNSNQLALEFRMYPATAPTPSGFTFHVPVLFGSRAFLKTSTDLANWQTLATVTNQGRVIEWDHYSLPAARYFRIVPE